MDLTDDIWKKVDGAYKIPYDVSVPLRLLKETYDKTLIKEIWEELWNELHHQGDVNIASYLAVPQLVTIGINKNILDWNLLALCTVIEQQRHLGNNPELPNEYSTYYKDSLKDLRDYVIKNLTPKCLFDNMAIALSTIATCDGRVKLGKAILQMEDEELLNEFVEQF